MKKCANCKAIKLRSQFHKNKTKHDGLNSWCIYCNLRESRYTFERTPLVTIELDGEQVTARACKKCEEVKPLSAFESNGRGGKKARCMPCVRESKRRNRAVKMAIEVATA
ncbi:hypothetical protein [Bacillus thuringiensis]|uniref:hypothetical protein n=1 Tax=Bacillus thuringiensis TaxID=1428 RepID=UPI000BFB2635|nr:hypothetical protein [Bacillus thuringiensis]PGM50475.1 hypothetical protein CN949_18065 [Bacillus thuringiensis]